MIRSFLFLSKLTIWNQLGRPLNTLKLAAHIPAGSALNFHAERLPSRAEQNTEALSAKVEPTPGCRPALTTHRERNLNRRIHFHRIAVQKRWLVAPLLHGVQSRLHQQRVT